MGWRPAVGGHTLSGLQGRGASGEDSFVYGIPPLAAGKEEPASPGALAARGDDSSEPDAEGDGLSDGARAPQRLSPARNGAPGPAYDDRRRVCLTCEPHRPVSAARVDGVHALVAPADHVALTSLDSSLAVW